MDQETVQIYSDWLQEEGAFADEIAQMAFTCRTAHQTLKDTLKEIADDYVEEWERDEMRREDFNVQRPEEEAYSIEEWFSNPVLMARLFSREFGEAPASQRASSAQERPLQR